MINNEMLEDILLVFEHSTKNNWKAISTKTIIRILYFSIAFNKFFNQTNPIPFSDTYDFYIDTSGLNMNDISFLLAEFEHNSLVKKTNINEYILDTNNPNYLEIINESYKRNLFQEKSKWISIVISILAIYGEESIYEFIFRDPEFLMKYKSQDNHNIDISNESETFKILYKFKSAFELELKKRDKRNLSTQQYINLYFDYVFSTIIKKESIYND